MDILEKVIKEINKSSGDEIIGFANDLNIDVEHISTGSVSLDWATGGGIPKGRITELYGPYSSGKTLIALKTIAEAQKQNIPCVFIDAELSFEKEHAQAAGVDLDKLILVQLSAGEKMFDLIRKFVTEIPTGLIIVDSVAAIVPEYEDSNETDKQTMALTARLMSKGLRIINGINNPNVGWAVVFINQIREKVGVMYGNPETTPGGRALGFFSSLRVEIRSGERYMEGKIRIGQEIRFKVQKSKVCVPHREGAFKYIYDSGIDEIGDIISLGLQLKVMEQAGAWYTIDGERFQGRNAIEAKAKEEPEFLERIKELIREKQ